jgi:hypothetical protein
MKKLAIFAFVLACVVMAVGQSSPTCDAPHQSILIGAFRVMNTAQMRFNLANHRYAPLTELIAYEETRKMANSGYAQPVPGSVVIGTVEDPLPGYALRVTVGSDGKSYAITATKNDGPCKFYGAATDERGIIFFIEPLH